MIATRRPTASAAERIRLIRSAWPVRSPWEKLSRATSRPARIRRSSISDDSEAGPIVATILVLLTGNPIRALSLAILAVTEPSDLALWPATLIYSRVPQSGAVALTSSTANDGSKVYGFLATTDFRLFNTLNTPYREVAAVLDAVHSTFFQKQGVLLSKRRW